MNCLKPEPSIKMLDLYTLLNKLPRKELTEDGKLIKYELEPSK